MTPSCRFAWLWLAGCAFEVQGTAASGTRGEGSTGATTDDATSAATATTTAGSGTSESTSAASSADTTEPSNGTSSTSDGSTATGDTSSSEATGVEPGCRPLVVEILPGLTGADAGREWFKLYNPCPDPIDLDTYALAYGFDSLILLDLQGTIPAEGCFVVGGPTSDATNFDPPISQAIAFDPQPVQEGRIVSLYDVPAASVTMRTLPIDALLYGQDNAPGFLAPDGQSPPPSIGSPVDDQSIHRTALAPTFELRTPPTPGDCPGFSPA